MKLKLAAMVAALLFSASARMAAQGTTPTQPRRPVEALKSILDLTDQQLQQLGDLRQAHQQNIRDIRSKSGDLGQKLRQLLQSANPDPAQLGSLLLQQKAIRQQIQDANTAYRNSALNLLTATQKQKVAQIQEALKLAPQAGPLAAFGLIEGPGGHGKSLWRRIGQPPILGKLS